MLTKDKLNAIRDDLDAALAEIGKKHGFTMNTGKITYASDSFTAKIEALAVGAKTDNEKRYEATCDLYHLPPLNTVLEYAKRTFKIIGMTSRSKVELEAGGKTFTAPIDGIAKAASAAGLVKRAPTLTLEQFVVQVNALQKAEVEKINANPKKLFGAAYHPYSESMLKLYHEAGHTPTETIDIIWREAEAENRAEARAS